MWDTFWLCKRIQVFLRRIVAHRHFVNVEIHSNLILFTCIDIPLKLEHLATLYYFITLTSSLVLASTEVRLLNTVSNLLHNIDIYLRLEFNTWQLQSVRPRVEIRIRKTRRVQVELAQLLFWTIMLQEFKCCLFGSEYQKYVYLLNAPRGWSQTGTVPNNCVGFVCYLLIISLWTII